MTGLHYISDYLAIQEGTTNKAIFCFSGVASPRRKFYSMRALSESEHTILYLNCPQNAWYLDGIPGLGRSVDEAVVGMKNLLSELNAKGVSDVLFFGGSMGGYGALLYGLKCGVSKVVCCGVELQLMVKGSNSALILRRNQKKQLRDIPDLVQALASHRGLVFFYWGDYAYHDYLMAPHLLSPSSTFTFLKNFGHPIPAHIHQVHGISNFIEHHFTSVEHFPLRAEACSDGEEQLTHVSTIHRLTYYGESLPLSELQELERDAESHPSPHLQAQLFVALARAYEQKGLSRLAHQKLGAAFAIEDSLFTRYYFALSHARHGLYKEAYSYLQEAHFSAELFEFFKHAAELYVECYSHSHTVSEVFQLRTSSRFREILAFASALEGKLEGLNGELRAEADFSQLSQHTVTYIDFKSFKLRLGQKTQLTGIFFTPDAASYQIISQDSQIQKQQTSLHSPKLAERYPEVSHAGSSRFTVHLTFHKLGRERLSLVNPAGEVIGYLVVTITAPGERAWS